MTRVATRGSAPPRHAPSDGLHPATALILLLSALVLTYGVPSPIVPLALLVAAAAGAAVSRRTGFRQWLLTLGVLAGPMLVMVLIVQGLFYPGEEATVLWSLGPAALTVEGLTVALQLWLRVAAMIALCALFALGTDSARAFDGMLRLRMPLAMAYVCATAMSLIPMLGAQVRRALTARAARGWDTSGVIVRVRLMPGIIAGVLTSSLVQLDQRHETLTQRGFGSTPLPAPLQDWGERRAERWLRWVAPAGAVALVAASLAGVLSWPSTADLIGGADG